MLRPSQFTMEEFHESPFILTPPSGIVEKQSIIREMALQRFVLLPAHHRLDPADRFFPAVWPKAIK